MVNFLACSRITRALPTSILLTIGIILIPTAATARVARVEITSREVVSASPDHSPSGSYEVLKGVIHLEVDPNAPANQLIVDLVLAPRNARGKVEFATDFELHKPVDTALGNRRLLYFVNNRGNKMGHAHFNVLQRDKNWLYNNGWCYLWCGWNCDVIESDQKLNIRVPVVTDNGKAITGKIYAEMISYSDSTDIRFSLPIVWGGSLAYPPVSMDNVHATLTARPYRHEERVDIPHEKWAFGRMENGQLLADPNYICVRQGFEPGWLYDLVYVGRDPKVTGLGLAAIRDVVSFFRYDTADENGAHNPLAAEIAYTYAWGHSQSGRLLNHFVYQNFNVDEKGRKVFDGIMANCPGAGKGLFNSRFAQTTRHGSHHEDNLFPIDFFPFNTVEQYDPLTGERGDSLARARKSGFLPRMFFINSSTDYWTRAASLLHTDVEGKKDAEIDPSVRMYSIAGRAHVDDRIGVIGRALLTALDEWVSQGVKPPRSRIPKIADGTLVDLDTWRKTFPRIRRMSTPRSFYHPYRLDLGPRWLTEGIADNVPPLTGPQYTCLVPQVDEDGNEIAGIRLPDISAPLATYTGWNMRDPSFSRTLGRNTGRVWPLPQTAEERERTRDPRRAVLERYASKADYLLEVTKSLLELKMQRFLLDEDVTRLLMEAVQLTHWTGTEGASRVTITEVTVQPAKVRAGDTVVLSATFEGLKEGVLTVRAKFREADNFYCFLNDDGRDGDGTAGDNVWAGEIRIPSNVPARQFHFEFQAVDKDFKGIYLKDTVQGGVGEQGLAAFTVRERGLETASEP
jgi:hypothetical protein